MPGYGVAVSKAQYAMSQLVEMLSKQLARIGGEGEIFHLFLENLKKPSENDWVFEKNNG